MDHAAHALAALEAAPRKAGEEVLALDNYLLISASVHAMLDVAAAIREQTYAEGERGDGS